MATRAEYEGKLRARFGKTIQASGASAATTVADEKAAEYVYKALDRQINKARGLLAYNGLLFASFNFVARSVLEKHASIVASVGSVIALLSCLPLLVTMVQDWGKPQDYEDAENDFKAVLETVWGRSPWLTTSLVLSIVATVFALVLTLSLLWSLLR